MKKFLIIGIISLFLIIGVLVYVLYFNGMGGGPNDQFTEFDIPNQQDDDVFIPPVEEEGMITGPQVLTQVSEEPVIGFREITNEEVAYFVYVEAGTGHIFSYDPVLAIPERLSNITVPRPREAHISADGQYVVIGSGDFSINEVTIITLPNDEVDTVRSTRLSGNFNNLAIGTENILFYTENNNGAAVAKQYDLESKAARANLFAIPFTEVIIDWGATANAAHLLFPKPAESLMGAVYTAQGGVLGRLPFSADNLAAIGNTDFVIVDDWENGLSQIYEYDTDLTFFSERHYLTEKCQFHSSTPNFVACAAPTSVYDSGDIVDWRVGTLISEDNIVLVDLDALRETFIALSDYTDRTFDIIELHYGEHVLFMDRTDGTLWSINLAALNQEVL